MFQEIRNALGQKDDKGYQAKTKVSAVINRVKDVEYSKSSGKPGQSLQITANGEQEWIKLIGKFDPLDSSFEGRSFDFLVWPFKPDNSPKTYLYAWIQRQSSPQTPPQAHQATNAHSINTAGQVLVMLDQIRAWVVEVKGTWQEYQESQTQQPPQQQNPNWVGDNPKQVDESDPIPF